MASFYDKLSDDVDYRKWSDFIEQIIKKYAKIDTNVILDLACGTGSMTVELSKKGYEMIGIDISPEMLAEAYKKSNEQGQNILFLNQDMCNIDLYGTIDACVCCLDSLNYITDISNLKRCLSLVNLFMNDGGLFIFDVNTPYKFKNIYGNNAFILENDGVLCAWQNSYDEGSKLCEFDLSFFVDNGNGVYNRFDEVQTEKSYTGEELKSVLNECSFEILGVYSDHNFNEVQKNDERWYYVCRAINNNK